ncbi:hypothetical protein CATMIT_01554, partial [Catenibacterium mitsuokai DSM 15897]
MFFCAQTGFARMAVFLGEKPVFSSASMCADCRFAIHATSASEHSFGDAKELHSLLDRNHTSKSDGTTKPERHHTTVDAIA